MYLALFTIAYNILEGLIATYMGYTDESLTLFGFGLDSFIEVISGSGIAHFVFRMQQNPNAQHDDFEKTALHITGFAFYALVLVLVLTGIYNVIVQHHPETTFAGLVISLISIAVMYLLMLGKTKVGHQLQSDAILADAQCTKVCIFMSIILLLSSAIYELFNLPYIDSLGTFGLAFLSFREGKECFEKANNKSVNCCQHH